MGYDKAKFTLARQGIVGPSHWVYVDTGGETDTSSYAAAGYFTDAKDRGVKVNDRVEVTNKVTNKWHLGTMTVVQDTGATQGTWVKDTG